MIQEYLKTTTFSQRGGENHFFLLFTSNNNHNNNNLNNNNNGGILSYLKCKYKETTSELVGNNRPIVEAGKLDNTKIILFVILFVLFDINHIMIIFLSDYVWRKIILKYPKLIIF